MEKENKREINLSNDFWSIPRPKLSNKETFKDVTIIKWNKDKENIVYSIKEKY